MPHLPNVGVPPRRLLASALAALVLATLLATSLLAFGASPAANADDATNGIAGAPSDGTGVDTRSRFSYQVDPGQHLDDFYLVRNTGTTAQTLKVFATDAFDTPEGAFSLLDTKLTPKDSGSWITFANGAPSIDVPLAPGASTIVSFRLAVPADASPGDHAGGLVVSLATQQGNIMVDRRIATRMYVRVKGELVPTLTVSSFSSTYKGALNPFGGKSVINFTVTNNGNVALGATMVVGVNTYFGIKSSDLKRTTISELLPGSVRKISVTVPGLPQIGYLNSHVSLVPTVEPDAINPGTLREVSRNAAMFAMPWWILAIVLLVVAVILYVRIRRRIDQKRAQAWIEHTASELKKAEPETSDRDTNVPA